MANPSLHLRFTAAPARETNDQHINPPHFQKIHRISCSLIAIASNDRRLGEDNATIEAYRNTNAFEANIQSGDFFQSSLL